MFQNKNKAKFKQDPYLYNLDLINLGTGPAKYCRVLYVSSKLDLIALFCLMLKEGALSVLTLDIVWSGVTCFYTTLHLSHITVMFTPEANENFACCDIM